ncbi:hypothetical protein K7G98_11520 [Saccharothrix sp. MB29]|nr:hypothetical protein [Saccharothrix sp. MB29]
MTTSKNDRSPRCPSTFEKLSARLAGRPAPRGRDPGALDRLPPLGSAASSGWARAFEPEHRVHQLALRSPGG